MGIWLANLEPVIGSEQGKTRPVVVISESYTNFSLSVINVLPISTRKNNRFIYPNEVLITEGRFGLPNECIVLCYQIRTIDKKRLIKQLALLIMRLCKMKLFEAIKFQIGII